MSKLPFTIAPVLYRRTVAEKLAPNGFIVHKKKSRFGLCVALASAIAFLLPFASQAFAHDMAAKVAIAADDPLYCVSM